MTILARGGMPRFGAIFTALALTLAGCASVEPPASSSTTSGPPARVSSRPEPPSIIRPPKPLQCVPFARAESGIDLTGDALTWWDKAPPRFRRGQKPVAGGVMLTRGFGGAPRGHVAVVRRIMGPREILIDHANWLNTGEITRNVPVRDVSPAGDWSVVQVWHIPSGQWGLRSYQVQGFIYR